MRVEVVDDGVGVAVERLRGDRRQRRRDRGELRLDARVDGCAPERRPPVPAPAQLRVHEPFVDRSARHRDDREDGPDGVAERDAGRESRLEADEVLGRQAPGLDLGARQLDLDRRPRQRGRRHCRPARAAQERRRAEPLPDHLERRSDRDRRVVTGCFGPRHQPGKIGTATSVARRSPSVRRPREGVAAADQRLIVTSVPIGVYGQILPAVSIGASTQPTLCGKP